MNHAYWPARGHGIGFLSELNHIKSTQAQLIDVIQDQATQGCKRRITGKKGLIGK